MDSSNILCLAEVFIMLGNFLGTAACSVKVLTCRSQLEAQSSVILAKVSPIQTSSAKASLALFTQ